MSKPKYDITWGHKVTTYGNRPFMMPTSTPEADAAAMDSAVRAVNGVLRADDAHLALVETLEHLQAAFGTLFAAYDAYPDDLGKHEAYPAAIGTLAQTIKMVQALDVSARSWKGSKS